MTLSEKLKNKLPSDSLHVHESYNNFEYVDFDKTDINLLGMEFIGICTDIQHKYDDKDCALVFHNKNTDDNHWIHITGIMYQNLIEIEELKLDVLSKDTHVYCTNCKHFRLDNDIPCCPFENTCDVFNPEDSTSYENRPKYERK